MPRPFMWRVSVSTALPVYRHSPRAGIGHWPLLIALADHFRQAPWYLTDPGDAQRVIDTYSQLDLLRALREAGVQRVRLRGRPGTPDRQSLTESLRARLQSDEDL
ncbi:hypothetical protein [Nocardia sp. NPDC050412]|uniref:hypothetical protein n=1 Tax=Nocardia sp. NPDC050412 TaxID=3364320 RepID=UPI0037981BA5